VTQLRPSSVRARVLLLVADDAMVAEDLAAHLFPPPKIDGPPGSAAAWRELAQARAVYRRGAIRRVSRALEALHAVGLVAPCGAPRLAVSGACRDTGASLALTDAICASIFCIILVLYVSLSYIISSHCFSIMTTCRIFFFFSPFLRFSVSLLTSASLRVSKSRCLLSNVTFSLSTKSSVVIHTSLVSSS
jgi:hypothetical protein